MKTDLLSFTTSDLAEILLHDYTITESLPRPDLSLSQRAYFTAQRILRAVWDGSLNEVSKTSTKLKYEIRAWLSSHFDWDSFELRTEQLSQDGTRKFLWTLHDGHSIESVLIPGTGKKSQNTLCISSQVGCAMGCTFCLTATQGLIRNLNPCEIVGQIYSVSRNYSVHKIVFMGMGEPLHNLRNIIKSIQILTEPSGFGISPRRITVSTSGLIPAMEALMTTTQVRLAVSLNASCDDQRSQLMPVNNKWSINELMDACVRITQARPRSQRVLVEYVLIAGVNDSKTDADRLGDLLSSWPCKLNLIPLNSHSGTLFKCPSVERQRTFQETLLSKGIAVTLRKSRGSDISAACGQLRSKH